ncbi:MAG: hypothetical protein HY556_06780 [Euryarchaeota archaeon]|nr:hypothetical protein [Euryarchaeota archaeon]
MDVTTRRCTECRRDKPVSGVWYMVGQTLDQVFVCESCYVNQPTGEMTIRNRRVKGV